MKVLGGRGNLIVTIILLSSSLAELTHFQTPQPLLSLWITQSLVVRMGVLLPLRLREGQNLPKVT